MFSNHFLSSSTALKTAAPTSHPSSPPPRGLDGTLNCTCEWNIFVCVLVFGGGFTDDCTGFRRELTGGRGGLDL